MPQRRRLCLIGIVIGISVLIGLLVFNITQEVPATTPQIERIGVSTILEDYAVNFSQITVTPPITNPSPYDYNPPLGEVVLSTPNPAISSTRRAIVITPNYDRPETPVATAMTPSPAECGELLCPDSAIKQVDGWVTLHQSIWYHRINDCPIKENIDVHTGSISEIHDVNISENGDAWLVRYVWTTYEDNGQTIRGHLERQRVSEGDCIDPEEWERVTSGDDLWLRKAGITDEGEVIYLPEIPWKGAVYKQESPETPPEEMFQVRFFGGTMSIECSRNRCWFATSDNEIGVFDKEGALIDSFVGPFYPFFYVTRVGEGYEAHSPLDGRVIFEWKE